ncbi:MAG: hypothetical protein CMF58_04845 [Lentimicrobiaceae bacterium]|nr:hypothetical protein [Lentimicrobiaceae bacterium]
MFAFKNYIFFEIVFRFFLSKKSARINRIFQILYLFNNKLTFAIKCITHVITYLYFNVGNAIYSFIFELTISKDRYL